MGLLECRELRSSENLTLLEKDYEPILAMLPEIRAIDPAWATCDTLLPLHDPPIALQKADSLEVKTTEISSLFTPSPSPAASLPTRLPAATAGSRANEPEAQNTPNASTSNGEDSSGVNHGDGGSSHGCQNDAESQRADWLTFTAGGSSYSAKGDGRSGVFTLDSGDVVSIHGSPAVLSNGVVVTAASDELVIDGTRTVRLTTPTAGQSETRLPGNTLSSSGRNPANSGSAQGGRQTSGSQSGADALSTHILLASLAVLLIYNVMI